MLISEWIDIPTLKILCRHASGAISGIILFKVLSFLVGLGFEEGLLKTILEIIDSFVLVMLLIWLVSQLAILLWKGRARIRNGLPTSILVA